MESTSVPAAGAATKNNAAVSGILTFVIADLGFFLMLFASFMVDRRGNLALFNQSSRTLNVHLGILNMLILVSSGACVVFAVTAARQGRVRAVRNWTLAAFLVGTGFGISKLVEYSDKFAHGIGMQTNAFYMYYFALTGAHFLHFLGGMAALAFIWFHASRDASGAAFVSKIEAIGLYWHMVDLLWMLIFPLLYVLGLNWQVCR